MWNVGAWLFCSSIGAWFGKLSSLMLLWYELVGTLLCLSLTLLPPERCLRHCDCRVRSAKQSMTRELFAFAYSVFLCLVWFAR